MGDPKGFLTVKRKAAEYRPVCERIKDYGEVTVPRPEGYSKEQASRCMDCGTPFCNWACPVGNYIPEWNDLMFRGQWKQALKLLCATNNLPEITGRICPALCEYSCVLGINDDAVTIRENELAIIERGFKLGLIAPNPPHHRSGKSVTVIGSGPAGLVCADQLNKAGHNVVVFEKDDKPGGILRYGIPDFKLDKRILDRRLELLKKEGVEFRPSVNVGVDLSISALKKDFDAVCLTGGSRTPRDMNIDGRDLKGIYFAMDYLKAANKGESVDSKGKQVVVIGGGDTGADCVGVAHREGASCVVQIELLAQPSKCRTASQPWPKYPVILKTSTSHEEGGERKWSISTKKFIGEEGCVKKLLCETAGTEFEIEADIVILALGFLHPEKHGLLEKLGVELDQRGNVKADENFMTSVKSVFSAGDMRRGQSLIVWAISEGRMAADSIDKYLRKDRS
ncbi:MAG: glutamate synthase subunit beta [Candidatus Omnitrophica bacterium]|nr:glutamate synthase subunit beta [Candidatus Omnitrophota bacterium]